MKTAPSLALCAAVALALLGNKGAEGIGFDLISSKVKCFSEEISGNTLVVRHPVCRGLSATYIEVEFSCLEPQNQQYWKGSGMHALTRAVDHT